MADSKKHRLGDDSSDEECIVEDMGSDEEVADMDEEMEVNEQVQVDFEGFGILDSDFHGIRQMLQQLFPKDNIDISEVANILIGQNFIGTLLKQSEVEEDDSDDNDDLDQVFGITSCISCNGMHKSNDAVNNILKFLLQNCEEFATDGDTKECFRKILEAKKEDSCLGWIINERFINIPPQVSLPMFEKLQMELAEARGSKHRTCYEFSHYLMICKTYNSKETKEGKKFTPEKLEYINSEEELFADEALAKFTYPLAAAASVVTGKWDEDSVDMQPCRTVLLLTKDHVLHVMDKLKVQLALPIGQ